MRKAIKIKRISHRTLVLLVPLVSVMLVGSPGLAAGECEVEPAKLVTTPATLTIKEGGTLEVQVENTGGQAPKINIEQIEEITGKFEIDPKQKCAGQVIWKNTPCKAKIKCVKAGEAKYTVVGHIGGMAASTLKCHA